MPGVKCSWNSEKEGPEVPVTLTRERERLAGALSPVWGTAVRVRGEDWCMRAAAAKDHNVGCLKTEIYSLTELEAKV